MEYNKVHRQRRDGTGRMRVTVDRGIKRYSVYVVYGINT